MIDGVGKRAKDVPVRLDLDLKEIVVKLADFHDMEQKKLLSRMVRWFDRQPELVQRLIVDRIWSGTESAVEQMLVQMLDDFRSGKLLVHEPDGAGHGGLVPDAGGCGDRPDGESSPSKKARRRDKSPA